jgi:hypothetical protein
VPKPSQSKRSTFWLSVSTAFQSIDGVKCSVPMFRGNNRLSRDLYLQLFEGCLKKYNGGFQRKCFYPQTALAFLEEIFVAEIRNKRVNNNVCN